MVDTASQIAFFTVSGALFEKGVINLTYKQTTSVRAMGIASMLLTGERYGKYRDYLYRRTKTDENSSRARRWLTEMFAFSTVPIPLYVATLAIAGADRKQIGLSVVLSLAFALPESALLGLWMDSVRKFCGLKPAANASQRTQPDKVLNI